MSINYDFGNTFGTISRAESFGFQSLTNGTRLYGFVPHIGPEAWFHQLHAPLSLPHVVLVEEAIGMNFPADLREFFLLHTNGAHLFAGSLAIFGKKTGYSRRGDECRQPFCLVDENTIERPARAKSWQLAVGFYRDNGSLVYVDRRDGSAFRTKSWSGKVLNRWPNFATMLDLETTRLAKLFDNRGHRLSQVETTPLPDSP